MLRSLLVRLKVLLTTMKNSLSLAFVLVLLGCTQIESKDWPEFRGPGGQGISTATGLPVHWSAKENVTWKKPIPGKAWSSPIILKGRIYMTTAVPTDDGDAGPQVLRVLALDVTSGDTLWDTEVFRHGPTSVHQKNSHASPTPLTDGRFLFVHFGTNGTACLDLEGNLVWRNNKLLYDPRHGSGGSPAFISDRALGISCDGLDKQFFVALDRQSGKILWKTDRPPHSGRGFSFTTPLLIEVDGRKQVVSPGSDHVCSYDVESGKEIWRVNYPGGYSVVPRPLYAHGLVFVCSGWGTPWVYAIRPDGKGDVTESHVAWKKKEGAPRSPAPLIVGKEIYTITDKGVATCRDAVTGKVHWRGRIGGNHSAAPLYAEGRIYFQSEEGEGVVITAGTEFEELARNPIGERTLASYAVDDGVLFIRSLDHLYRIEEKG